MAKRKKLVKINKKPPSIKRGQHFKIPKAKELAGFFAKPAKKEDTKALVQVFDTLTSDDPRFYHFVNGLTDEFLRPNGIQPNFVSQFIAILHSDLSADVYINDFPIRQEILRKVHREVKAGGDVFLNDIADITRVEFPGIEFKPEDRLAICIKVGWKFGLHFNFWREGIGSNIVEAIPKIVADLYRYLTFEYVYQTFEPESGFDTMLSDGWFPFSAIIGNLFRDLANAYKNEGVIEDQVEKIVSHFDRNKFDELIKRWSTNQLFKNKETILQEGIDSYLDGRYAASVKTISSEIDGILRITYSQDSEGEKAKTSQMLDHILNKGLDKTGSQISLLLPRQFLEHLRCQVFANFSLKDGDVPLSRHSANHGVVEADDYTQEKALQFLLALDQIYYLVHPTKAYFV